MSYILIDNGTLIDGNGGNPLPNAAVLIEGNQIQAVGQAGKLSLPTDTLLDKIDAQGGFILPGLIDAHVHMMLEKVDLSKMMTTPFSLNFYQALSYLKRTLEAGITSVRDAGGTDFGVKQAIESGLIEGPRLQISISVLTITGGHADFWMRSGQELDFMFPPYPGNPGMGLRCDGPADVLQKVRAVLRAGADVIKVCATGGVYSPNDDPRYTQFSPEELKMIVDEAARRDGVKVMAHAQGSEGIKNAVRAGVHSIEHGIYLDDEAIDLMLKYQTFLVPTLLAPVAVLEAAAQEDDGTPPWAIEKAREVVDIHRESIAKAYQAGVSIAMGTDAAVMPHGTNLRELGLMCEIGMSPMEAIIASTKTAATCLGWQDKVGTLEAGKLADVIITTTNPLQHIRSLEDVNNIPFVMKDGRIIKNFINQNY